MTSLRAAAGISAIRRTLQVTIVLAIAAPLINVPSVGSGASAREAANAFTSVNAAVVVGMVIAMFLVTQPAEIVLLDAAEDTAYRRRLAAHSRTATTIALGCVVGLAGIAAGIALPLLHHRGLPSPPRSMVSDYVWREAIATARLTVVSVALSAISRTRDLAIAAIALLLVVDGVVGALAPGVEVYGPIGALNAFSDPTHHHRFGIATGGLLAFAWAMAALVAASLIGRDPSRRNPLSGIRWNAKI